MSAALAHRGPDDAGEARLDGVPAGRAPAEHHRPRARPPADARPRRARHRRPERRDLQPRRAAPRARGAAATRSARAATPRCSRTPTRSGATRSCARLRGMFAIALWDAPAAAAAARARPLRHQAAVLRAPHGGRLAFASELTALARAPGFSRELDPDAVEAFLAFNCDPGAADRLPRGAQAAARATCSRGATGDRGSRATRGPRRPAGARAARAGARRSRARLRERLRDSRARPPRRRRRRSASCCPAGSTRPR